MGRPRSKPRLPRVVLDTNLVLSALVFSGGAMSVLRRRWQDQRFTPLVSKATAEELLRVLSYPKFGLSTEAREDLLADYLPYCESVRVPDPAPATPLCRDPFDVPFLELAIAGKADFLVTGDSDLLSLASKSPCPILRAGVFLERLETN